MSSDHRLSRSSNTRIRRGGLLGYPPKMFDEIEKWVEGKNLAERETWLQADLAELDGGKSKHEKEIQKAKDSLEKSLSEDDYGDLLDWTEVAIQHTEETDDLPSRADFGRMSPEDRRRAAAGLSSWFDDVWSSKAEDNKDKIAELEQRIENVRRRIDELGLEEAPTAGIQEKEFDVDLDGWDQARDEDLARRGGEKVPTIIVKFYPRGYGVSGGVGWWDEDSRTIGLRDTRGGDWRQTLKHELRHMGQSVLSRATGHALSDEGDSSRARPAPGMPSRHVMDFDVRQRYRHPDKKFDPDAQRLKDRGIEEEDLHALDDVEFYTRLGDAVDKFKDTQEKLKWTPEESRDALKLFTGVTPWPRTHEDVRKTDPRRRILDHIRPDPSFGSWKEHNMGKWKKGVGELVKATTRMEEGESTLQRQWKEYLDERHEGGRKKIPNPNHRTRERHPEITVNYLMNQEGPEYRAGRDRIRRDFARWRSAGAGRREARAALRSSRKEAKMSSEHKAGILKHSKSLQEKIEKEARRHMAAMHHLTLEEMLKTLPSRKQQVDKELGKVKYGLLNFAASDTYTYQNQKLLAELMNLAKQGMFPIEDVVEFLHAVTHGEKKTVSKAAKKLAVICDRNRKEARKEFDEALAHAKDQKKKMDPLVDVALVNEIAKKGLGNQDPVKIKLTRDDFPFLHGKFEDNVKKMRGEDAGILDGFDEIKVRFFPRGPYDGRQGSWAFEERELHLFFPPPAMESLEDIQEGIDQTIEHELGHLTQTLMLEALGLTKWADDPRGWLQTMGPGLGPKKTLDPEISQFANNFTKDYEAVLESLLDKSVNLVPLTNEEAKTLDVLQKAQGAAEAAKAKGLSPMATYHLDDYEFYTTLGSSVREFLHRAEKARVPTGKKGETRPLNDEELRLARDLTIGRKWVPKKKSKAWIAKNDPSGGAVTRQFYDGRTEFFRHMKKYKPEKYKKAVAEFHKAVDMRLGDRLERRPDSPKTSLQKQWKEYLDEKHEGGRRKIPNPNYKTRERHPEITVNYLMRQQGPEYRADKDKIRRDFALWRGMGGGVAAPKPKVAPKPKDNLPGWLSRTPLTPVEETPTPAVKEEQSSPDLPSWMVRG